MTDTEPEEQALTVHEDRIVVGQWSAEIGAVIAANSHLRRLLREGRTAAARSLIQSRCAEEQAALIAVDTNPEELLSLTGMNEDGRPGYLPAVVNRLPSVVLTELLVPRNAKLVRFNTEVLAKMSSSTFRRTVEDTLDPIYYHDNRSAVSWEWLEIVAALPEHRPDRPAVAGGGPGRLGRRFAPPCRSIPHERSHYGGWRQHLRLQRVVRIG